MLKAGYHAVPAGMIATIVTSLEMFAPPALRPEASDPNWRLERLAPDPTEYRGLYRTVGEDWLWFDRLRLTDAELVAIIGSPDVEVYRLSDGSDGVGLLELDFRVKDECELDFFGLSRTLIGGPLADESGHPTRLVASDPALLGAHLHPRPSGRSRLLQALRLPAIPS